MSLVKARHLVVGLAAIVSVLAPWWVLRSGGGFSPAILEPLPTALSPKEAQSLDAALAQPLFQIDRQPPSAIDSGAIEAADGAELGVETVSVAAPPSLVGIAGRAGGLVVALVKGSDGKTMLIRKGETVDGWKLTALGRARAIFTQKGVGEEVALDFRNKPDVTAPTPPVAGGDLPPPSAPAVGRRD